MRKNKSGFQNFSQSEENKLKKSEQRLKESEERFGRFFVDNPLGIALTDLKTRRFIAANKRLCKMLGYDQKELLRKSFADITHPEDVKKDIKAARDMLKGNLRLYKTEKRYIKKNGEMIIIRLIASLIKDQYGKPSYALAMIEDISEKKKLEESKKKLEEEAHENLNMFKTLFENAIIGVLAADLKSKKFFLANPAAHRMFGYKKGEMLNLGVKDIHPKKDLPWILKDFREQAQGRLETARDIPCLRKDGSVFYADICAKAVKLSGKPYNLGFFRDITERKKAEDELKKHKRKLEGLVEERTGKLNQSNEKIRKQFEELQTLDQLKTQFLSFVSHELRTPLTPISAQLQRMLAKELPKQEREESLRMILRNTKRLDRLTNDILDISRIRAGRMKIIRRNADPRIVVERAVKIIEPLAKKQGIKINTVFGRLPLVFLDEDRIKQVLINLLDNAIRHSGTKVIEVTASRTDENILVCVNDKGKGIAEKERKHVFEMFHVIKRTDILEKDSGLGLAICKGIVEEHGGKIWVKTAAGKGSSFCFRLPISRAKAHGKEDKNTNTARKKGNGKAKKGGKIK